MAHRGLETWRGGGGWVGTAPPRGDFPRPRAAPGVSHDGPDSVHELPNRSYLRNIIYIDLREPR